MNEPSTSTSGRICVLINRKAGRKQDDVTEGGLRALFGEYGLSPTIKLLRRGDDFGTLAEQVIANGFETVVAAGGDGTIAAVAGALHGSTTKLGIIPLGTFNYFARSIGVPETVRGAVDAIANGVPTSVSVATINGKVFLNNANFGVYPDMLAERETNYARWGRSRAGAYWSALLTLTRLPKPLALTISAPEARMEVRTPVAFVFSNAFQMRQMGLEGADCVETGKLAVLIAPNGGRWGLIKSGFALLFGKMTRGHDFNLICAQEVEIVAKRKSLRIARDGERERAKGPYRFAFRQNSLTVITPRLGQVD